MRLTPESRLLLRIAARIVPEERRDEWGREWESELWYWLMATPQSSLPARVELSRICMGAIVDAFYLRVDKDTLVYAISRRIGHPVLPLATAFVFLLAIGIWSGWFTGTRRAIRGPDYPEADRVALLDQLGRFRLKEAVPATTIESWDRKAPSLEGAAAYFWYRTVFGSPAQEVVAAKVGASFFRVLGVEPALGRLFDRPDAQHCRDCAVLSYDAWRKLFDRRADGVVGQWINVDGRPARVIGVLPKYFWFMDDRPAVWTLYVSGETWRGWDVPPAGAVCRLRPGINAAAAQEALRRTSSPVMPRATGRWATITPLSAAMRRSLPYFLPLAAVFLGVAAILSIFRGAFRRAGFGLLNAALWMVVLLASVLEFTDAGQPFAIWWFVALSIAIVYCSYQDSRVRCPVCLRRLIMPVRIGHVGQVLLEKAGTELCCPKGHGMLYTPEMQVEAESWARV